MNELTKTMAFAAGAVLLVLLAVVTAPAGYTPDSFIDQGQPFFPDFTDPNQAVTLEVVTWDDETASADAFKVTSQGGVWTIPSHHGYPADGEEQLAKTAAGVIQLSRDDFRSDNAADHEAMGVGDPLDDTAASLKGRGRRVTMRGENDQVLADIIIGKEVEDRPGYRFVRLPGQKRVYSAKVDFDISTRFQDWIKQDLLEVDKAAIDKLTLLDYSVDERSGVVRNRGSLVVVEDGGEWKIEGSREEVDSSKVDQLLTAVDELSIVGVRPKPQGLSEGLNRIEEEGLRLTRQDQMDLQDKGYFFSVEGSLLSNEGELQVRTNKGVRYTLRFGEIVYGSGETISAGGESEQDESQGPGENRYLFVTTEFLPDYFPEPPKPANLDFQDKERDDWTAADQQNKGLHDVHQRWKERVEAGRRKSQELNARFADWYYVISDESFRKVRVERSDLIKEED
ncbi:MAG TPA: DUF4340 domain-containing protein [Acidobacteriota bacterium]|nr:DUF4340 domain-containing protein [Acidobacteriota bacterium]